MILENIFQGWVVRYNKLNSFKEVKHLDQNLRGKLLLRCNRLCVPRNILSFRCILLYTCWRFKSKILPHDASVFKSRLNHAILKAFQDASISGMFRPPCFSNFSASSLFTLSDPFQMNW